MQPGGEFIFLSSESATVDAVPRGYEVIYGISKVFFSTRVHEPQLISHGGQSGASYLVSPTVLCDVYSANYRQAHFAHYEEPNLIIFPLDPGWTQT